jgi:hypothetical protein
MRVLAVPKSIAMSVEKNLVNLENKITSREGVIARNYR